MITRRKGPNKAFSFSNVASGQNGVNRAPNKSFYGKIIQTLEVVTMKKFLLGTMIGLVLAMDLYGIVNQYMINKLDNVDHIKETTTTVYME